MDISLNSNVRIASKDEVLFREGDEVKKIYIIQSGTVLCLKKSKERLIPILSAGAEQILGEDAALSKTPYNYSAVVTESCEIVEVDASLLAGTLDQAPYWLSSLMSTLGERLAGTSQAIAEHRIVSTDLTGEQEFTGHEENRLKKLLA